MPQTMPILPILPATPIICGPTAGGKSDLAVGLALLLREQRGVEAQILTADAFQVYRGLDIGTAKPTPAERRGVEHHLIDIVDPSTATEKFTLDDWLALARPLVAALRSRQILPIVVGGTHLYVKALIDGLFDGPEPDLALREQLAAMDAQVRRAELERVDPHAAARIHFNDVRRTVRALEVYRLTGTPISAHQTQWDQSDRASEFQLITVDWPTETINRRINARVKRMFELGLLEEVRTLEAKGSLNGQAGEALGYKQLRHAVQSAIDKGRWPPRDQDVEDAQERIKIETRRFAKNQRTWLRRLQATPGTIRLDAQTTPPDQWPETVLQQMFTSSSQPQ